MVGRGKYSLRNAQTSTSGSHSNQSWWPQDESSWGTNQSDYGGYGRSERISQPPRTAIMSAYHSRPSTPPIHYQPLPISILPTATIYRVESAPLPSLNLGNEASELGNILSKLQRHVSLIDDDNDDLTNLKFGAGGLSRPITGTGYNYDYYTPIPTAGIHERRTSWQENVPTHNKSSPAWQTTPAPNPRPRKIALEANPVWGFGNAPSQEQMRNGEQEKRERQEQYRRALQLQAEEQAQRRQREAEHLKRSRMINGSDDGPSAPPAQRQISVFPQTAPSTKHAAREFTTSTDWAVQDKGNNTRPETSPANGLNRPRTTKTPHSERMIGMGYAPSFYESSAKRRLSSL